MRVKTPDKKRTILQAATNVFATNDFHEGLIDDVARTAGVGKGTIYRYFQTKDELYFQTVCQGLDELGQTLASSLPGESSATRRLEQIARGILKFFWNRRDLLNLLYSDAHRFVARHEEFARRREMVRQLVHRTILAGIERGEFRGVDARITADLFWGMVRTAGYFRRDTDSLDDLVSQILGVFGRGVIRSGA